MAGASSAPPPRRVSFSTAIPPFSMSAAGPRTPTQRARPQRSPFPSAAEAMPADYFGENASAGAHDAIAAGPVSALGHWKHDSIGDPFMGEWPRLAGETDEETETGSAPASPSPKRALPRLDFSGSTPIMSRGTFTPRPVRTRQYSPSRAPGRKISLINLASSYVEAESGSSEDEFDDALEELGAAPEAADGLNGFPVVNLSGPAPSVQATFSPHEGVVDLTEPLDEEEADAVDLELDLGGLSLGQSSVAVNEILLDTDSGYSTPTTPGRDREVSPASTPSPEIEAEAELAELSTAVTTPSKGYPDADVPASPCASFQIPSPLASPARLSPSVPSTPSRESAGYVSDESDSWVPRRRGAPRRIVVSDDEADPSPRRTQARGLRGRVPAAIAKLNAADSEDEPEGTETQCDESMGSLRDFIVDSDCEEEVADANEPELDWDEADAGDIQCGDDDLPVDHNGIPIIDLVSDSDESDEEDSPASIADDDGLHYSPPPPPVVLPDLDQLSLRSPPRAPLIPSRTVKKTHVSSREWADHRERYAQKLFDELDSRVFDSRLSRCGTTIEWGARLRTTAGQAHSSKQRHRDGTQTIKYKIVLSNKVLSSDDQIRDTLAHEMCHLACWVISNEHKNPHGRVFKSWGSKVHTARPDIIVTTKHSYVINFKYEWQCSSPTCAKVYRRHSKSIDTSKQVCGACRSKLQPLFASKASTLFQDFLRDNMKAAKAALPTAKHGEVMRALSKRWGEAQSASPAQHDAYWRSLAA